jgi:DNA primase
VIPDDKIAEIRDRTDIVAVVGEYVPLKRSGSSFKGLCPFHPEKTPSFYVHPARQFFHCFGCQTSGDVFSFLSKIDGRPFPDVARSLAEQAGVELPAQDSREEAEYRRAQQRQDRLAAVMDAAAGYFARQLQEHPLAHMARAELEGRGLSAATVESFRLGYAPHGWDGLLKFLAQAGWSPGDAEELGLIVPRRSGSGHYDRFRHRLMFPIRDLQGRVVAFSGRALEPPPDAPPRGEPPAKYINSPEGPLYKKGEILFGLHEGRVATRREGWALVCEGNFDLLALHQAGFGNAVAPMGTALTEKQAKLLRRFAQRVVLLFDGDRAGRKAVREAFPLLQSVGLVAHVVTLPSDSDPDTFLRSEGAQALQTRVEAAPGIVEFLIDDAAEHAGGDAPAKAESIASLGPVLAAVDNPVERRLYVERVARRFGIGDIDAVRQQLRRGLSTQGRTAPAPRQQGQGQRRTASRNDTKNDEDRRTSSLPTLQCELLGAILDCPELIESSEGQKLDELLTSSDIRAIFHATSRMFAERGRVDGPALLSELAGNAACGWLSERLAIQKYDERGAGQALRDGLPQLARQNIERELPRLRELILQARRRGDDARADELTRHRNALYVSSNKWMQGTKG